MQKIIIILGIVILLVGLFWPWISKIPLGQLPGDIVIKRPNFHFYFPITTMILISLLITLILYFLRRWF